MNTQRWLLPFTRVVDLQAIEAAVCLARQSKATLVALSLLAPSQEQRKNQQRQRRTRIRLEQLQESQDFLEAVRWKAIRQQVPIECHEVLTENISESITAQAQEMGCQRIILARHGMQEILLADQEIKQVLTTAPAASLFLALPPPERRSMPNLRLLPPLRRLFGQQDTQKREQVAFEEMPTAISAE